MKRPLADQQNNFRLFVIIKWFILSPRKTGFNRSADWGGWVTPYMASATKRSNSKPLYCSTSKFGHQPCSSKYNRVPLSLWTPSSISLLTKIRKSHVAIRPVLNFWCKTWPSRVEDTKRLGVFYCWWLRVNAPCKPGENFKYETSRWCCSHFSQSEFPLRSPWFSLYQKNLTFYTMSIYKWKWLSWRERVCFWNGVLLHHWEITILKSCHS